QLDFSATPKDNHGRIFQHVVCDAPLGEAVDGGIVKTPIIGRGQGLSEKPNNDASELVTVVEHNAFVSLYRQELSQEGLPIEIVDVDKITRSTVTIFPDRQNKDVVNLDIRLPDLSGGYFRISRLENLHISDVKEAFSRLKPLPLGKERPEDIEYEGRHLFTNEIVERMKIRLPLLENGMGAISYYREELEHITGLKGTHQILAPLLESFLTEILFEKKVDLFDPRLLGRLADSDVREYIRAVFVPLILSRTTIEEERSARGEGTRVSSWKPFQATHSETHPAVPAQSTLFNLVPCNREFEVAMTQFLDHAQDVDAFCKNAGPQALRIDYLSERGRLSLYTPDFFARIGPEEYLLIETKGREDRDVRLKAKAAIAWCRAASEGDIKWSYLYAPQKVFEDLNDNRLATLVRMCDPYLKQLLRETESAQLSLPFGETVHDEKPEIETFVPIPEFDALPSRYQKAVQQAVALYLFLRNKEDASLAPVFTTLLGPLDEAARCLILRRLQDHVPGDRKLQREFFRPEMEDLPPGEANYHRRQASNLERTLIDHNGLMPMGLLHWCLDYQSTRRRIGGVFGVVREKFAEISNPDLSSVVNDIYRFRNEYIAHQERELSDPEIAKEALRVWARGLFAIWKER
ncbi:MAG: restriction endonuclease subunit R, partial [Deltaproteobacteria bacterium]|nr:restriction endonuclease subunit R [Deltaproteobacteria bacterium]